MTSTEFASKYRLLKNVATRGARSFLAQQVELGRMVMVHYLDAENVQDRAAMLARLQALEPPGRAKLLEIADVDGTPVAVTLFISSFKDFATWLDSVSPPVAPTEPRAVTPGTPDLRVPLSNPAPAAARVEEVKRTPGEFTRIFGKVDEAELETRTPTPVPNRAVARGYDVDSPTEIMEVVKPPQAASPVTPPPQPSELESGSSFTAIFGSLNTAAPKAPDLPPAQPAAPASSGMNHVTAPPPPIDPRPAAPQPVPQAAAHQPGEFTQLFQRLSSSGGAPVPAPFSASPSPFSPPATPLPPAPFVPPDVPRPLEATPRADAPPPPTGGPLSAPSLAVPSLGVPPLGPASASLSALPTAGAALQPPGGSLIPPSSLGGAPPASSSTPPRAAGVPSLPNMAPPPPPPPSIGASMFASAGPSEFTRMLRPIAMPPSPPVAIQPPAAPGPAAGSGGAKKTMLPLIIALVAVVVLTIALVVYFVMRR